MSISTPATHYELLGVHAGADIDVIKSAYRTLVRKNHPDIVGESGEAATQALNEAFHELSDIARRASYDRKLAAAAAPVFDSPTSSEPFVDETVVPVERSRARLVFRLVAVAVLIAASAVVFGINFADPSSAGIFSPVSSFAIIMAWVMSFKRYVSVMSLMLFTLGAFMGPLAMAADSPLHAVVFEFEFATLVAMASAGVSTLAIRFSRKR